VKISLDFETRSEADLRKVGAHLYACHPSTQAICLAFAFDQDEEVHLWHRRFDTVEQGTGKQRHAVSIPEQRPAALEELFERIRNGELLWAWNAEFERLIWQHVMVPQHGWPTVPLEQWRCSAAQAASYALPRSLHAAGKALGVKEQKLVDEGKSNLLMLKLAKPRKARKAECRAAGVADADEYRAKRGVLWWEIEDELRGLFSYCQQDVRAERAISETLRPLPEIEQRTWLLDQKINDRGVKCDLELVAAAQRHIAVARAEAEEEIRRLTGGMVASTTRRTELLQWLHEQGVRIPDTAAESIDAALEKDDAALRDPAVRRVLVVWRASHKTSLAKYASMRERTGEDGRIRGNFRYHGSSTGRWCMPGDAEVLTRSGWVKLSEWNGGDIVQWEPTDQPVGGETGGRLVWAEASALSFAGGAMWRVDSRSFKGSFTEEHQIPTLSGRGKLRVLSAGTVARRPRTDVILSGMLDSRFENEIHTRVIVMVQADGSFCTDTGRGRRLRFRFRKQRKIQRCETLLRRAGVPYSRADRTDATEIVVRWVDIPNWLHALHDDSGEKKFAAWVLNHDPVTFIDEARAWDSYTDPRSGSGGFEYVSCQRESAEWVVTMAHLAGKAASITQRERQERSWNVSYRVFVRNRDSTRVGSADWSPDFHERVYCAETVTGFFLTRYGGCIHVTGNSGTGRVQLQNLPRGKVANMDRACDSILRLSTDELNLEYGNVLELLSGTIRGAICAPSGRKLCVGDFSSIEARGVFWLAGQRDALQVLASGEDIYKDMASSIYGVPVERVSSAQRHVGKTIVLGGLYQMGPPKFQRVCGAQGSPIPLDGLEVIEQLRGPKAVAWFVREYGEDAQEASELWRQEHAPDTVTAVSVVRAFRGKYDRVPRLWRDLEMAAIEAVTRGPGAPAVRMQKGLQWAVRGRFLHCRLPSGRLLSYCDPFVKFERTPWGKVKPRLRFWGLGRTRKWEEQDTYGGALCENVVQGLCRDLLRDALLRLDAEGYSIVTHTHDEAMCEEPESEDLDRFLKLMGKNPSWARGFPLSVEGWSGKRYRK